MPPSASLRQLSVMQAVLKGSNGKSCYDLKFFIASNSVYSKKTF
jgi:hypothetical protein